MYWYDISRFYETNMATLVSIATVHETIQMTFLTEQLGQV